MPTSPHEPIRQVAYAVEDVEEAARSFALTNGAGPFFVRHHPPMATLGPHGERGVLRHSSAFGQWGDLQIELVHIEEPAFGPEAPAVHHVAWFAPSLAAESIRLEARGWPLVLQATSSGGLPFAFFDASADLGHLVEVYEPAPALLALYAGVRAAAAGWTGHEPVRPLSALPR